MPRVFGVRLHATSLLITMARYLPISALGLLALCSTLGGCVVPLTPDSKPEGSEETSSKSSTKAQDTSTNTPEAGEPSEGVNEAESTAPKTSESTSSSIPTGSSRCENISPEHRCIPAPPEGWFGPVQPQKSDIESKLLPCAGDKLLQEKEIQDSKAGPDSGRNVYVSGLARQNPARCTGCSATLDKGTCLSPQYVVKHYHSQNPQRCGKIFDDAAAFDAPKSCHGLHSGWLRDMQTLGLSATPPLPAQAKPSCKLGGTPKQELPLLDYDNFYRICDGVAKPGTCDPGQVCHHFQDLELPPRQGLSCIFSRGENKCPAGAFNDKRIVIYGGVEDTRECKGCDIISKPGRLSCEYEMRLFRKDTGNSCTSSEGELMRSEDLCLTYEQLKGSSSPFSVRYSNVRTKFDGECSTSDWEAVGKAKLNDALTLCCMEM